MTRMIPNWAVTLVWFLAGVFATGAFWYFLGQKNKLGTLWTGYLTVAFALLAIALQIHNDLLSRTRDAQMAVDVPPKTEPPMKQEDASDKGGKDPIEKEVSGTSERKAKASVSQTMVNSPGSVQVAGNLTLAADRRLIQTLTLEIRVKQQTDPRPPAQPETSMGLGSSVAFFTKGGTRIRFTTPVYQIVDQQLDANTRQLTLVYSPETPDEILGKDAGFLREIDKLAVNYAEIFQLLRFAQAGEATALDMTVRLNGVEVIAEKGSVEKTGVLAKGQASFSVGQLFQKVPETYEARVARLPQ